MRKSNFFKDAIDARYGDVVGELAHEDSRHQCHADRTVEDVLEVVLVDVNGSSGADFEAVAAVDAAVGNEHGLPISDT